MDTAVVVDWSGPTLPVRSHSPRIPQRLHCHKVPGHCEAVLGAVLSSRSTTAGQRAPVRCTRCRTHWKYTFRPQSSQIHGPSISNHYDRDCACRKILLSVCLLLNLHNLNPLWFPYALHMLLWPWPKLLQVSLRLSFSAVKPSGYSPMVQ